MRKKLIFIGMHSKRMAKSHMDSAIDELRSYGIPITMDLRHASFETPHVRVRYVCSGDTADDLIGYYADAVFGSVYEAMKIRLRPNAEYWMNQGMNSIEYITLLERDALNDEVEEAEYIANDIKVINDLAEKCLRYNPVRIVVDTRGMTHPETMVETVFKFARTVKDRDVHIDIV